MVIVKNITHSTEKLTITPELKKYIELIKANGVAAPEKQLPSHTWEKCSFTLSDTNVALANALRRALVSECVCIGLTCEFSDIETNDDFVGGLLDCVQKCIQQIPIYQSLPANTQTSLNVLNNTTRHMQVKASAFANADKLFPASNITIATLRPGKYLRIKNVKVHSGTNMQDAGSFTLLNSVEYTPVGPAPFDSFTQQGARSMETEYREFAFALETAGNISIAAAVACACEAITREVSAIMKKITEYAEARTGNYTGDDCTVEKIDNVYRYTFTNCYISSTRAIAGAVYEMDKSISFISASVDRYDKLIGVIRITHADRNKILIAGCKKVLDDLLKIQNAF